ncbi:MAG: hypothetical protein HXS51_11385 [Theionarchaea archaeon]|nr:hypothetical protein [Theionarchaea archaeon]
MKGKMQYMDGKVLLIVLYGLVQVTAIVLGMRFDVLGTVDKAFYQMGQNSMLFISGSLIVVVTLVLLLLIRYKLSRIFYAFLKYGLLWVAVALILFFLSQSWYTIVTLSSLTVILQRVFSWVRPVSTGIFAVCSAAVLGSYFEIPYAVALFGFLILLDILSEHVTHHMGPLAEDIIQKGAPLMFRVPTGEEGLFVGSADIVFPCMLAVSAFTHSLYMGGVLASLLGLGGLLLAVGHTTRRDEVHAGPYASLGILGLFIGYVLQYPEWIGMLLE